ncbi:MAG: Pyrimidine reductase riboflavin biosynthesis RibD [Candidatus Methanohalarchaeum thermophilum]|uniref:2,5-diamino-6-(ribosylamino)-4(3H)-pyrimidinone 5'-phosphate reductase n=1 Tax=Methanohalarchaeum thermophilum TaxID=1903181 RepID=A0A1Q6DX88_METT1|nr:MAG: Pyrimidine reductase riboflavin biosynthesis RibD [Candidatus Methanohalarchaeum thermophilum]
MKKPYILINSALTLDGKISTKKRKKIKISSKEDFIRVKKLRKRFDGILVGIGTVLADDPKLNVENTLRIVLDSRGRIPLDSNLLEDELPVLVAITEKAPLSRVKRIEEKAEVIKFKGSKVDLKNLLKKLREKGIKKLLVEGGGTVNWSFLKNRYADEVCVYISNLIFGGKDAPTFVDGEGVKEKQDAIELKLKNVEKLGEGLLLFWELPHPKGL